MKQDYRAVCTSTGYSRAYYVIKSASFHVNVESALLHLPLLLATHVTHTCSLKHTFSPQFILLLLNIFKLPFFSFFSWLLYFRMLEKQSVKLRQHRLHCVRGESAQLWFWKRLKIYTYLCCACVHMCLWCCQHFETYYIFHNHDIICSAFSSLRGRVILWA